MNFLSLPSVVLLILCVELESDINLVWVVLPYSTAAQMTPLDVRRKGGGGVTVTSPPL